MTILCVGGPFAGRAFKWHLRTLPPYLDLPVRPPSSTAYLEIGVGPISPKFETVRYRRGDRVIRIVVGELCTYGYEGDDKYGLAKTEERVVGFVAPFSLQELRDRALVEDLIRECS